MATYAVNGEPCGALDEALALAAKIHRDTGVFVAVEEIDPLTPPPGYTAEELERDNPYNQWMYE